MLRARELDPLSPSIMQSLGWAYHQARRFDEAIATYDSMLDAAPDTAALLPPTPDDVDVDPPPAQPATTIATANIPVIRIIPAICAGLVHPARALRPEHQRALPQRSVLRSHAVVEHTNVKPIPVPACRHDHRSARSSP